MRKIRRAITAASTDTEIQTTPNAPCSLATKILMHWKFVKLQFCNPLLFRCRFNFGNFGTSIFTEIKSLPKFQLRVGGCSCLLKLSGSLWTEILPVSKRRISALPKIVRYRNKSGSQYLVDDSEFPARTNSETGCLRILTLEFDALPRTHHTLCDSQMTLLFLSKEST